MVRHPLECAVNAIIVTTENGCPRHQAHILKLGKLGNHGLRPKGSGRAVHLLLIAQQASAEDEILFANDHACACSRADKRSRKTGGAAADHQQVTERIGMLVMVWIRRTRTPSKTSGTTDQRLIQPLPKRRRPHKGFVIEAGADHWRKQRIHAPQIKMDGRPRVLCLCLEPIV